MGISPEEYKKLGDKAVPPTKSLRNICGAFFIGGLICTLGQLLIELYELAGLAEASPTAATISLIFLAALLTGIGVYDKIALIGGGGTLVPVTGFANGVAAAAMEFKSEGWILGLGVKIFSIAGPVIVYGTAASFVYGVIFWLIK